MWPLLLIMAGMALAIQFDCEYKQGGGWRVRGKRDYHCAVKKLNVTTRNVNVDGVLVNHAGGNNNVKGLDINSKICHFIPKGIANIFGNLIMISIHGSHLKKITKSDLQPFTELVDLSLHYNDLEVIEKDLFMYNKKLTTIYLNNNKLRYIDNTALESTIAQAHFVGNPCVSMNVDYISQIPELRNKIAQNCQNIELAERHDEEVAAAANTIVEKYTPAPKFCCELESDGNNGYNCR